MEAKNEVLLNNISKGCGLMTIQEFKDFFPTLTKKDVKYFLWEHQKDVLPAMVLGMAFEKLYIDKGIGMTIDPVPLEELVTMHSCFTLGNGGGWSRDDTGYLGKRYHMHNIKMEGRIVAIEANGIKYSWEEHVPRYKRVNCDDLRHLANMYDNWSGYAQALEDCPSLEGEERIEVENQTEEYFRKMLAAIRKVCKGAGHYV